MFLSFIAAMVAGSAVHALWVSKALVIKFGGAQDPATTYLGAAIRDYWSMAFALDEALGAVGVLLILILVLLGKTHYPRWTAIANPAVVLCLEPLASRVPSPIGSILVGGATNLSLAVFFLVCVATTWKRSAQTGVEPS